ncbi:MULTISPECIES: restriction endonuclease subunit S [Enterobacter]|uniref:restriction endonuclease subunit S n=1 Tax=Enterobacter TaxID=547 RepID=UPI0012C2AD86|nr:MULTISPECIES: restriction endonuclease subunit S [Enterobacter]EBS1463259.1 restriction endonuclease subunit S [Salmonella enterica subsp. enterica serovar Braenderup]EBS5432345.1 restriction endonuclease subunit S [Salmonella enterica subsp. enterica serovar Alachua]EDQ5069156.1 restriction endonuclease subunit S [Salmonella enterica]EBV2769626.1 restriction endonuclease subunit S [Salmonella enterica subsp. enterica serovar Alachua]EBW4725899.1 restriction endonuclease subunit S [Salmonel
MSKLNYLEKLLEGIEVEWFPLGKVAKKIYSGGTPDTKKTEYWEHGTIPWMSSGEVNLKTIKETETFITEDGLNNSSAKFVPENSIVMALAGQGKTRGKVARTRIKLTTNQSLAAITFDERKINSDYIFHFLETQYDNLRQISSGNSGRGGLNLQMISAYKAPIPCPGDPEKSLAIQSEIVRILDKFTELTAELTAELTLRKKQYNYYRNQLLSFEEGAAPFYPLGQKEVGEFIRGGSFQKKDFTKSGVGCIHYGQIFTHYGTYANKTKTFVSESLAQKCRKAKTGNLVIATTSENDDDVCKAVAWLGTEDIAVSSDACIYRHNLNPKYVSYFFQTESFQSQKRQYITGTKVRRVNADNLAKILIPVPSQEEQTRIVDILDKFDLLTSSISQGLPREIELRQKQYEYYRDLLFSFPRPETASN